MGGTVFRGIPRFSDIRVAKGQSVISALLANSLSYFTFQGIDGFGYNESAYSSDGSLFMAGGNILEKYDETLNVVESKSFSATSSCYINELAVSDSGNVTIVGTMEWSGRDNGFIIQTDSNMNIISQKRLYAGQGGTRILGVDYDTNGNVFVSGTRRLETTGSDYQAFVAKFDSSLNLVAYKTYGGSASLSDNFTSVAVRNDGNVAVVGRIYNGTYADGIVATFDNDLTPLSSKRFYGTSTHDELHKVKFNSAGNLVISGYFGVVGGDYYGVVFETSFTLNILGSKRFSVANENVFTYDVSLDGVGNIYAVGIYYASGESYALFSKIDSDWSQTTYYGLSVTTNTNYTDSLNTVSCNGSNQIVAGGAADNGKRALFVTNNNGLSSTPVTSGEYEIDTTSVNISSPSILSNNQTWSDNGGTFVPASVTFTTSDVTNERIEGDRLPY